MYVQAVHKDYLSMVGIFEAGVVMCALSHLELPLQLLYLCAQHFRLS